jgi:hypothetical protein
MHQLFIRLQGIYYATLFAILNKEVNLNLPPRKLLDTLSNRPDIESEKNFPHIRRSSTGWADSHDESTNHYKSYSIYRESNDGGRSWTYDYRVNHFDRVYEKDGFPKNALRGSHESYSFKINEAGKLTYFEYEDCNKNKKIESEPEISWVSKWKATSLIYQLEARTNKTYSKELSTSGISLQP